MPIQISLIQENDVVEQYLNGESILSLSKRYNTNTHRIRKILNNNNIQRITQAKRNNPSLNEDYFEIINSNEKAYWLGWFLTDGCIEDSNDNLQLTIQKGDKHILEILEKDLGINNHIHIFNKDYIRFSLGSKKIRNSLVQYGIVPNKSHILSFPNNIPEEYEVALLRGMFEGDGGLTLGVTTRYYKHRNKSYTKPYQELSFSGTYDMCKGFQTVLLKYLNITLKTIEPNNSIYRVRWSNKNEILQILHLLYKDCDNHYLKRKYELYQKLKVGD